MAHKIFLKNLRKSISLGHSFPQMEMKNKYPVRLMCTRIFRLWVDCINWQSGRQKKVTSPAIYHSAASAIFVPYYPSWIPVKKWQIIVYLVSSSSLGIVTNWRVEKVEGAGWGWGAWAYRSLNQREKCVKVCVRWFWRCHEASHFGLQLMGSGYFRRYFGKYKQILGEAMVKIFPSLGQMS